MGKALVSEDSDESRKVGREKSQLCEVFLGTVERLQLANSEIEKLFVCVVCIWLRFFFSPYLNLNLSRKAPLRRHSHR